MNFGKSDIQQINEHGLTVDTVLAQLTDFKNGFPYADIVAPATIDNGIMVMNDDMLEKYGTIYDKHRQTHKIVKFVPASGAATRMFRDLFEYLSCGNTNPATDIILERLTEFAFYDELKSILPTDATPHDIISYIVTESGLNYGHLPKGLLAFHKYDDGAHTAVDEHLGEGAGYATSSNNTVNIHFTVSPEHIDGFNRLLAVAVPHAESKYGVKYNIELSTQKSSTDTIAVNPDNTPFRTDDGKLLFRPAGHGALIENLNEIDADIIFIKNIDNVCHESKRQDTIKYKRALAGYLVTVQEQIFTFIHQIDAGDANATIIQTFIERTLGIKLPADVTITDMRRILNRPLRVCGVVPNVGAPGGGPFWVVDDNGTSLQIIESAQIAPDARDIMNQSSHFNPVDLVCATRDYMGNKFNLPDFVDAKTGFISEKSSGGRSLRAMERPGLWNGAMANWNTILVQVPNTTFTPAKVITDLISPAHK